MQCYSDMSPKREPMDVGYGHVEPELMPVRRLELPAPPGKEFRAPVLLGPPLAMPAQQSVIQCMRPPPPPPPPHPPRFHKPPMPSMFEEPTSSIPDLGKLIIILSYLPIIVIIEVFGRYLNNYNDK